MTTIKIRTKDAKLLCSFPVLSKYDGLMETANFLTAKGLTEGTMQYGRKHYALTIHNGAKPDYGVRISGPRCK